MQHRSGWRSVVSHSNSFIVTRLPLERMATGKS
jgi:hypothetical protein